MKEIGLFEQQLKSVYKNMGWNVDCQTECICKPVSEERQVILTKPYTDRPEPIVVFKSSLNCPNLK